MGRTILSVAFLSARVRGSVVSTGLASMVATGIGVVDSEVIATFAATEDSGAIVDSTAVTGDSVVVTRDSMAVTDFTAAVHMVAVASTEVAEVTAVDVANAA